MEKILKSSERLVRGAWAVGKDRSAPPAARLASAEACRARLYEAIVGDGLPGIAQEEIEIHFAHMPSRYWSRVDTGSVRWHLNCLHEFLSRIVDPNEVATSPVVRWRHFPDRGITEVLVCTWDRVGLLAKVAGAFAEVGLNIVRADIFTRADSVVLDIFQVCDENYRHVDDESRLERMAQILDAALLAHRELALLGLKEDRARLRATADGVAGLGGLPVVKINNQRSEVFTILEVEARDRVGLLYLIFRTLADCEVDVAQAVITTEEGVAGDVFYLTDANGGKITDETRVREMTRQLWDVVA
jgi:[protein-PII] uridylyltransferase